VRVERFAIRRGSGGAGRYRGGDGLVRELLFLDEGSPRPVLAVPHLLAGESSAYYHGYVLAEMAVRQTRAFFLGRDGYLVDNPRIGPELRSAYWAPGNSLPFGELVERLTRRPVSPFDLARHLNLGVEEARDEARASIERLRSVPPLTSDVRLGARIRVVHGRESVAEFEDGNFEAFAAVFADWIDSLGARARG